MSIFERIPDPRVKGKKEGYNRAAKKYKAIYMELKNQYEKYPFQIESEWDEYEYIFNKKIYELQKLEKERKQLEKLCNYRKNSVSGFDFDIESSTVKGLIGGSKSKFVAIGIVCKIAYSRWIKKFEEAEIEGYNEMKKVFEEEQNKLRDNLILSKTNVDENKNEMIDLMFDVYHEIAENKVKIQELKVIIGGA